MIYKATDFLGIKISAINKQEIVDKILDFATTGRQKMITYLNAHCVNVSFVDPEYRKILNLADLVYAGGKGVLWASRLFSQPLAERVNILDFFDSLAYRAWDRKLKIYLLGGKPDIVQRTADELKKKFPGLEIVGFHHGFFNGQEDLSIIQEINFLSPDILMVGLGVPRQEKWIYRHLKELDVNLCWGIGAAFEWLSGYRKRAPGWMIRYGLEWLHRLKQEPARLWKRYLIGNFVFIYRILRCKLNKKDGVICR